MFSHHHSRVRTCVNTYRNKKDTPYTTEICAKTRSKLNYIRGVVILDAFTITISHNFARFKTIINAIQLFLIHAVTSGYIRSFCGASQPCIYRVSAPVSLTRY